MRLATVLLAVVVSALALMLAACGADGESGGPTTTIPGNPVQASQDEAEGEVDDEENGDGDKRGKEKKKEKDRGEGHANGKGDDSV